MMAVQSEFVSLVLPRAVAGGVSGGFRAFEEICAGYNALADESLIRVSAMSTREIAEVIERLRAAHIAETWAGGPSMAVVELTSAAEDLPRWLRVGDQDGHRCVWSADAEPGPVVSPFKMLMARLPLIKQSTFYGRLKERGIEVRSADVQDQIEFVRDGDAIPGLVILDDDGRVCGVVTFPPSLRFDGVGRLTRTLEDIDAVVSRLAIDAAG